MKYYTLLLTPLFLLASQSTLTPSEHSLIHSSNHRPMIKMQQKRNMHKLHKIDEQEAAKITKKETNEEVKHLKLTHSGRILKYIIKTENYILTINALDGAILNKEKIR